MAYRCANKPAHRYAAPNRYANAPADFHTTPDSYAAPDRYANAPAHANPGLPPAHRCRAE